MLAKLSIGIFAAIIGFEAFYTVNTNVFAKPIGSSPIFYASRHSDVTSNFGFNQLDAYIKEKIFNPLPPFVAPRTLKDMGRVEMTEQTNIVLFDETTHWFAYTWYLQPYFLYYRLPVTSFYGYLESLPRDADLLAELRKSGVKGMYYISSANDTVLDWVKKDSAMRKIETSFAEYLEAQGRLKDEIKDSSGHTAFKIYYIEFHP